MPPESAADHPVPVLATPASSDDVTGPDLGPLGQARTVLLLARRRTWHFDPNCPGLRPRARSTRFATSTEQVRDEQPRRGAPLRVTAPLADLADHLWDAYRSRPCVRCAQRHLLDAAIRLAGHSTRPVPVALMCRRLHFFDPDHTRCPSEQALRGLAQRHGLTLAQEHGGRVVVAAVISAELSRAALTRFAVTALPHRYSDTELAAAYEQWLERTRGRTVLPALYLPQDGVYVAVEPLVRATPDGSAGPLRSRTRHPGSAQRVTRGS